MLEILKFIFSDFWIWLGTVVILTIIADAITGLLRTTITTIFALFKK